MELNYGVIAGIYSQAGKPCSGGKGVIALGVSVGPGSPRRGSRKRETEINRAHKPHNMKSRCTNQIHIRTPRNSPFHLFDGFLSAI